VELAPPHNVLRKLSAQFSWSHQQQRTFQDRKLAVMNPRILRMADFPRQFILQADTSSVAVSAVLFRTSMTIINLLRTTLGTGPGWAVWALGLAVLGLALLCGVVGSRLGLVLSLALGLDVFCDLH
jgi:hypothetical protein